MVVQCTLKTSVAPDCSNSKLEAAVTADVHSTALPTKPAFVDVTVTAEPVVAEVVNAVELEDTYSSRRVNICMQIHRKKCQGAGCSAR